MGCGGVGCGGVGYDAVGCGGWGRKCEKLKGREEGWQHCRLSTL